MDSVSNKNTVPEKISAHLEIAREEADDPDALYHIRTAHQLAYCTADGDGE